MFFYDFNSLDEFIHHNLNTSLKTEKETVKKMANLYDNKKKNLLSLTDYIFGMTDFIDKNKLQNFYEITSDLKKLFENSQEIEKQIVILEENIDVTMNLYDKNLVDYQEEIKANLVEYNKQKEKLSYQMIEFETFYTSILNRINQTTFDLLLPKSKKKNKENQNFFSDEQTVNIEKEPHDNNSLIVSEKKQKAYLPFFYTDIKKIYENDKTYYKTMQDVINDLYVLPLARFKNSSLARLKETFYLIRKKEKGSITKALDLGLELMFKYELNPIIIAACRNLEELDIYLDCLEENELDAFSCFTIKFEIMPQLTKKSKNTFLF